MTEVREAVSYFASRDTDGRWKIIADMPDGGLRDTGERRDTRDGARRRAKELSEKLKTR
jgi:hypothetical protein